MQPTDFDKPSSLRDTSVHPGSRVCPSFCAAIRRAKWRHLARASANPRAADPSPPASARRLVRLACALLVAAALTPRSAAAQDCALGGAGIFATPAALTLLSEPFKCDGTQVEQATLRLTGTGGEASMIQEINIEAALSVFSLDGHYAVSTELQPTQILDEHVKFHPPRNGRFTGEVVVLYGYGLSAMQKYRRCVEDVFGAKARRKSRLLQEVTQQGPDFEPVNMMAARAQLETDREVRDLFRQQKAAEEKASKLAEEKRRTVADLRAGYFCSQCKRAKSEFERAGEDFYEHVRSVNGVVVAAAPAVIAAKEREYDEKIGAAWAEARRHASAIQTANGALQNRLLEIETKRQEIQRAFDDQLRLLKEDVARAEDAVRAAENRLREYRDKRWWLRVPVSGECNEKLP